MKIAFFECNSEEENYFKENFKKDNLVFNKSNLNERNAEKFANYDCVVIFVNSKISLKVLEKLKKIKYIVTMSTGFDHIDILECKKRRINVSNVPFYGENTVAEHAFSLILSLSRKLKNAFEKVKKDEFDFVGLEGFDLKNKTIGIVGAGHIGRNVAKIAKGFDMKVLLSDPHPDKNFEKELDVRYVSFKTLLKKADIISLHVPLNNKTKHLINKDSVKLMKKGNYLINTSRGAVVDSSALKYGLDNKIIAGAGLDVLEGEENIKDEMELLKKGNISLEDMKIFLENHEMMKRENVVVTPHSAFYSREAIERIWKTTLENIIAFKKGKIKNKVKI